jgi:hypothetical protein
VAVKDFTRIGHVLWVEDVSRLREEREREREKETCPLDGFESGEDDLRR